MAGFGPGGITDVRLGGASGGTEVIAARSRRIGQSYYSTQTRRESSMLVHGVNSCRHKKLHGRRKMF